MKKTVRLLCLLIMLCITAMAFTLFGAAESACERGGVEYDNIRDAISDATAGDVITLKADVTEPVRIEKAVVILAGEYDFAWYSSTVTPTVDGTTYTFAPTTDIAYIDWFVGYRNTIPERLAYAVGSTPVYYGNQIYGDYTLADNDLKMTGVVDANGNAVSFAPVTTAASIPSYYCQYESEKPRFKLVLENGSETIHYISTDLETVSKNAPSGATIVLLDDIFYPYYAESSDTRSIKVSVSDGKTLNFDFAGHTVIAETPLTMFSTTGNAKVEVDGVMVTRPTTLNVYSSLPGASLFLGQAKTNGKGGAVMNVNSGSVLNFGDYGEYSGRNISTYSPCAANVYNGAVCNIRGASIYRIIDDYVGFLYLRSSNATLNIEGARIFAVNRDIQIAFGTKDSVVIGSRLYAKDTLFATLAVQGSVTGDFIRYISDGCEAIFEGCSFDTIPFRVERYKESAAQNKVKVYFDSDCSFNKLPGSYNTDIFTFEQIRREESDANTPKFVYTNDITTDVIAYNTYNVGKDHDYTLIPYEKKVGGYVKYTGSDYRETATEIVWYFGEESKSEWWEIGATPYPFDMSIPDDNQFVRYYVGNPYPVEEAASYDIVGERLFPVKFNLTLSKKLKVNVYIPYYDDISITRYVDRVSVGANTISGNEIKDNLKPVTVDGERYYKVTFEYEYSKVPDNLRIVIDIVGSDNKSSVFSEANTVNVAKLARHYLEGDYDTALKENIKGMLYAIKDAYAALGKTAPNTVIALIDEKFPKIK